jgi:DivIVA domain-containing protein
MGEGHGHGHDHAADAALNGSTGSTLDPPGPDGLLDPVAVRNQVFTVVRLREGYDLAEVDAFLGLVETTLTAVLQENQQLQARSLRTGEVPQPIPSDDSATRIIELAHEAAERTVTKAHQEANAILSQARARAEQLQHDALNTGAALHRATTHETHKEALGRGIQTLHAFIADFDTHMKQTLEGQITHMRNLLDQLHHHGESPTPQFHGNGAVGEAAHRPAT